MTRPLAGVHTIMPTPFTEQGAVDEGSLTTLTEFLIGLGVDGLVVLGVLGEAPKLSESEQDTVIRTTVAAAAGRVPVLAGTSAHGTALAVQKSARARRLGAEGLLVAPPPVQNDAVIFEHYRRISEAVDAPIVLHDYPAVTGIALDTPLVARLFDELEHVEVIKLETTPSITKLTALRTMGCEITVVGGLGGMFFLEELERGSDGIMTGFSFPDVLVQIHRAFGGGRLDDARRAFYGACPILRYEFQPAIGLAIRKEVYRQRGAIHTAFVRHPGAQIDDNLRRELSAALEHSGLDVGAAA